MTAPSREIYTVGYSTQEWDTFLSLLQQAGITAVADVRSHPTARLEQYRREHLSPALRREGIEYVFLGDQLGARRTEDECFVDDRVVYRLVAKLPAFLAGIKRLEQGIQQFRIALMCAEKEPLDCHRGLLIAPHLKSQGWRVKHLLADGTVETLEETEKRLIQLAGNDPLFDGKLEHEEILGRAYSEWSLERTHSRG